MCFLAGNELMSSLVPRLLPRFSVGEEPVYEVTYVPVECATSQSDMTVYYWFKVYNHSVH